MTSYQSAPSTEPSSMLQAPQDTRRENGVNHLAITQSECSGPSTKMPQSELGYDSVRYQSASFMEGNPLLEQTQYTLFRRRWIGLAELTLLNFAVGWGNAAPSVVSTTATRWFNVSYPQLNWLSIASALVFLIPAPTTIWVLNRFGPKLSIIIACVFTVIGNWIIYASAVVHSFPLHVVGTVINAISLPFIMASPTRYSRMWFDDHGRTLATALPSLAYPLGGGVGALSGPYMVKPLGPLNYDGQALIIALVFTAIALPSPFLPSRPPKPPSNVAAAKSLSSKDSLKSLAHNPIFYLQFISFSIIAGSIETITNVTNQAIAPYGFPQVDAGYAIAFLVFVGIGVALIISPILDRTKAHLITSKIIVVIIASAFTALPFIPQTGSPAGLYALFAIIGASSLSIEPCVLEFQAAWTHPVSPAFTSVICWSGAKLMGAIFTIVVGNALVAKTPQEGQPADSLFNGLIFLAVMCWLCVPLSWMTGNWIFTRTEASKVEGNQ